MTKNKILGLLSGVALCAVAAAIPSGPAFAQTAPAAAEAEDEGVGEIIVTAQRREQNLQDVPLSMAAFNAEALTEIGANNIEAINGKVPNVVVEHVGLFPAAASLSMRGVGYSGIESFTDPDVAVYINGVYQARNAIALSSTVDVNQIEVLRGPQGTLYGRNAYAGVVSLRTNRADTEESSLSAAVTLGNFGRNETEFVGNLPLVEGVLGARLAVRTHEFDGFFENNGIIDAAGTVDQTIEGDPIGHENSLYVRPSLRFTPNENLTIDFIAEIFRERSEAYPAIGTAGVAPVAGPGQGSIFSTCPVLATFPLPTLCYGAINPFGDSSRGLPSSGDDPFRVGTNLAGMPADYDSQFYVIDAEYQLGNGSLRAVVSMTDSESEVWADTDGTNQNMFSSARYEDYNAMTAELQYVADLTDRLNLVSGITFLADEYHTTQLTFTDLTPPFPTIFTPFTAQNPVGAGPSYINNTGQREAWAAFAQVEYHLTDPLSVVVGGRYSWERKHGYQGENTTLLASGLPPTTDFAAHPFTANTCLIFGRENRAAGPDTILNTTDDICTGDGVEETWSNFAPRLGVNYALSDDVLLYAFWQRAFKSGGFNAGVSDRAAFVTPYDDESVDSYEGGFKSEWLDNRLRLNVNAFFTEYADLQRSAVTPSSTAPSGVVTVVTNAASVESYGLEIEASARVTSDFTLFANIGWNKAQYSEYCADINGVSPSNLPGPGQVACGPAVATTPPGNFIVPIDNSGLHTLRAPEWDTTFGGSYDVDLADAGELTFNGSVNYRGEVWTQLLNVPYSHRDPMTVWDGNIVWAPASNNFTVTLWGRNLTDEVELLNYVPVGAFAFAHPTPPRTYGVTIRADF